MRRLAHWRLPGLADVALASAVLVIVIALTAWLSEPTDRSWWPGGVALVVVGALALLWRRRAPVAVLIVTLAVTAPYYALGYPDGPAALSVAVAMYTVASRSSWPRSVAIGLGVLVLWVGVDQVQVLRNGGYPVDTDHYTWIAVVVTTGVAVGAARRARAATAARIEEQARLRVERERLRIAREVHDVVSHSLAMTAVQAGVGAHVADRHPDAARAALVEIKAASSAALRELRSTLELLRSDDRGEAAPVSSGGLSRLPEIVRAAKAAGIEVRVRGTAGPLAAHLDDVVFAVAREAVTNTVRHARDVSAVTLDLTRVGSELRLRVADDGRPTRRVATGHGLIGLAERVSELGGRFSADGGVDGFVVEAAIPLVPAPSIPNR